MKKIKKDAFSCEDCEMAIIAGTVQNDPAAVEHLKECAACREFAEFQKKLLQIEPVISDTTPGFSQICSARRKQQEMRFNCLKFIVLPTAVAAAVCLSAAGMFWHMQSGQEQVSGQLDYAIFADENAFAALLEESTVTLAWDQATPRENAARELVQDLRENAAWNIEMFNPYNEDLL